MWVASLSDLYQMPIGKFLGNYLSFVFHHHHMQLQPRTGSNLLLLLDAGHSSVLVTLATQYPRIPDGVQIDLSKDDDDTLFQ